MIRSIHVLGSHQLGGADRFFIRLVEALNARGHRALAVLRADSPVARLLSPSVEQVRLPMLSKWDVYSRWRLSRLIMQCRPQAVQSYMGRATRLTRVPPGSAAVHIARLGGFYKIAGYYEHPHAWIGNTRAICRYLRDAGLPAHRVFHIGNFVPTPRPASAEELEGWRARLGVPHDAFIVVAFGRLLPKKGFADLLDAWATLPAVAAGRPLRLLVVGDGSELARLRSRAESLGIDERVVWAGWQDDTAPFYGMAHAFVCPSRHEPLGNVILEAWMHRLPVLSTRNEGASELVEDCVDGLLTPLRDPPALAEGLRRLVTMLPEEREALAHAGHAKALREHGEQAVIDAYLALYEQLAIANAGQPALASPG